MKRIEIAKEEKIVVMVTVQQGYSHYKPYYANYDDPRINRIQPCIQQADGTLKDLRTGEDVPHIEDAELWNASSGTVFEYPDGKRLLISRKFDADRTTIVLEDFVYQPTSMVLRKTMDFVAKKAE